MTSVYQILGGKAVKNVKIDPQTTKILSTDLNVPLSVSNGVSDGVSLMMKEKE